MYIPLRQLAIELQRSFCWKQYLQYQKAITKVEFNNLRVNFLETCKKSGLIPDFLRFRIPTNGCFDDNSVKEFQRKLLYKEILKAKEDSKLADQRLAQKRKALLNGVPSKWLPSIAVYTRAHRQEVRKKQLTTHNKKLLKLSTAQEQPLFNVKNTVLTYELDVNPPSYVMETLALGPKNAVLDKFNPHDALAELDMLLNYCKANGVSDETITYINVKTLTYINKCKQLKPSRNLIMPKKYLTANNLVAVLFDKGIGICIMKREMYQKKLDVILNLPQFEKVTQTRKNAKNAVLKEEERILSTLKQLRNDGKINGELFEKLKPIGSQPARIYGLAKIHKQSVPVRPVLSMPGSSYHPVGIQIAEWLSNVPECQINTSTKEIADHLKEVTLEEDEEIVSFDVTSLYTNVPVAEAIEYCADLLYNNNDQLMIDVNDMPKP